MKSKYYAYRVYFDTFMVRWCELEFAANGMRQVERMRRYGFGEKIGESEKAGLAQYEYGVVEFSEKAAKHATQEYPKESPAGAVALELAQVGGVDLSEYADFEGPQIDFEALHEAVQDIDGVGEETADKILEVFQEAL